MAHRCELTGDGRGTSESRAKAAFSAEFGVEPIHLGYGPGRVNLIGDHTDYSEGFVMPVALDIGCAVAAGWATEKVHEFVAVDLDNRTSVPIGADSPDQLSSAPDWARYVVGVIAEWRAHHSIDADRGVRLAVSSTVPPGSGLSSSAALEVSVASALDRLFGRTTSAQEMALLCQRAEHRFAGVPCGIMDQLIACIGSEGHAMCIDCRSLESRAVPLPGEDKAVFVLINSGVGHRNDDGAYAARRAACERAASALDIRSLREATLQQLEGARDRLDAEAVRAAEHVLSENQRVQTFADALESGELSDAGALMNQSHHSLSRTYRVSCPELDAIQAALETVEGAYGARMTGGGFGGWIVALLDARVQGVMDRVRQASEQALGQPTEIRPVRASNGAAAS